MLAFKLLCTKCTFNLSPTNTPIRSWPSVPKYFQYHQRYKFQSGSNYSSGTKAILNFNHSPLDNGDLRGSSKLYICQLKVQGQLHLPLEQISPNAVNLALSMPGN
ncbi:hypothetical protein CDAR_76021 [Caerostris darwini]|uniref:Uncharacterized protein n=1 Tax=Caerostris darwini TaxID=1538125 RepID=A0AAV4QAH9_9ARAC|nr:hypothetical protein CDAR_76021 [Caerostris darwini]